MTMRIAIVHYHLQPGGVTRIIQHQVTAMAEKGVEVVVLTGKQPPSQFPGVWKVVEGVQYEHERPVITGNKLVTDMMDAARDALGALPDVWHFHNHSLGKSLVLPLAIAKLAEMGQCLLLQIHDFPEDGRPENYRIMLSQMADGQPDRLAHFLYPRADHVHYSVLNARDYNFLQNTDEDCDNISLLDNPVELSLPPDQVIPVEELKGNLWMYPTRAIRRKNLGEFLLWAALAEGDQTFATTLGPDNPREWKRYNRWKEVAQELRLPMEFELGAKRSVPFTTLLQQAKALVTTSVSEGFGMAFLEPWLVGRPVTGRNLPEITDDFCQRGICLPWSYNRLDVPVEWVGKQNIADAAWRGLASSMGSYGRKAEQEDLDSVLDKWIQQDMVDFGRLNEELQEQVLYHVRSSAIDKSVIRPANLFEAQCGTEITDDNRNILLKNYCLKQYGMRLHGLYQKVAESSTSSVSSLDGEKLLDAFLAPERLHLLQVD